MTTTGRSGAPPKQRRPASREIDHQDSDRAHRNRTTAVAAAAGFAPVGRRRLWLLLVPDCPFCGQVHAHRGGPSGGARAAGCGRGAYELAVTQHRRGQERAAA